jgi:hypothetical protein
MLRIVVLNNDAAVTVQELLKRMGVEIEVRIDHKGTFYFL